MPVVILISATQYVDGLRIGANDYITKPFNIKLLIARCNNLINSRKLIL